MFLQMKIDVNNNLDDENEDQVMIKDFYLMCWGVGCAFSRLWTMFLFRHTLWILELPKRQGDVASLMADARLDLQRHTQTLWLLTLATGVTVVSWSIVDYIDPWEGSWSPLYAVSALMPYLYFSLKFFQLFYMIRASGEAWGRSLGGSGNKIFFNTAGELMSAALFLISCGYYIARREYSSYPSFFEQDGETGGDIFYINCCREYSNNFIALPFAVSASATIISLFPFSAKLFFGNIALLLRTSANLVSLSLKSMANVCERIGANLDETVCPRHTRTDHGPTLVEQWASNTDSFFDFAFAFGTPEVAAAAASNLPVEGETGEATILREVGSALEDTDTYNLVIPPEFISISAQPFAAGGFGQVHAGMFAGKKVAVKKVFTQLSGGELDEFNHEVRILNNLRGVPHVLLLHGVSFIDDRGEHVYLIVLEWCPVSLAQLIYAKESTASSLPTHRNPSSGSHQNDTSLLSQPLFEPTPKKTQLLPDIDHILFLSIIRQLTNALRMLHYKGYVHRDLKPQNILFANPDDLGTSLRVCDFGSARITDSATGKCSMMGDLSGISPAYAPPEVIIGMGLSSSGVRGKDEAGSTRASVAEYDGRAYDMYSLGIIVWEVWHQIEPDLTKGPGLSTRLSETAGAAGRWDDGALTQTAQGYRPDATISSGPLGPMPPVLLELQASLWDQDPKKRPNAAEVKTIIDSEDLLGIINELNVRKKMYSL